ncbi:hypothetical protein [Aquabacter cavernae]|uniref:hypothetical protein n=1 Tax=Aquabacter cavernae TaxID=2496029 RepID=UPI0013DFB6C7|nr:hypothetical protein [Aquabacter cavernae]
MAGDPQADPAGKAVPASLPARLAIAKQLLAAAGNVLAGRNPARRIMSALRRLAGPSGSAASVPANEPGLRIVRRDGLESGTGPVCLFVAYAPDGRPFGHTLSYCASLRRAGARLVLILVTDRSDRDGLDPGPDVADAVLVRENSGYDFAAWADALRHLPDLWGASEIWFANDSVYHSPSLLPGMLERVRASGADVVALTGSAEVAPHFQSYFFVLKAAPDRRAPARGFWDGVRPLADKLQVIRDYEVRQKAVLEAGGLSVEILHPAPQGPGNHLQQDWRGLLAAGFPFVKVELLRDNPFRVDLAGWRPLMEGQGFDVSEIAFHLGTRPSGAAALMELR